MKVETGLRAGDTRLEPVRHWRLHLGAHKTATTHLQETLTQLRPALAAQGVDFIPSHAVRARGLAPQVRRRRLSMRMPVLGHVLMRRAIEGMLEPLRLGPATVALSEENLLGMPRQIFDASFYPQAGQCLARLASLGQRGELAVFLSVRSLDTFLPSAYAETLKHRPAPGEGFDGVRTRLLARPPSWFRLVERLRAAAPAVALRVWRHEDYRRNARAAMSAFCGCEIGALPDIPDPIRTRSPSAAGIQAAEALPENMPPADRRDRVREIYATADPDGGRFRPFSDAERVELRAAYAMDIERIERAYPGTLMQFAPAPHPV